MTHYFYNYNLLNLSKEKPPKRNQIMKNLKTIRAIELDLPPIFKSSILSDGERQYLSLNFQIDKNNDQSVTQAD